MFTKIVILLDRSNVVFKFIQINCVTLNFVLSNSGNNAIGRIAGYLPTLGMVMITIVLVLFFHKVYVHIEDLATAAEEKAMQCSTLRENQRYYLCKTKFLPFVVIVYMFVTETYCLGTNLSLRGSDAVDPLRLWASLILSVQP